MAKVVRRYAQDWVSELRNEITETHRRNPAALDFAEVIATKPQITVDTFSEGLSLDEDELIWMVDPSNIKKGDIVTVGRDPSGEAVVLGVTDGNDPDPTKHPEGRRLKLKLAKMRDETRTWKPPVTAKNKLPVTKNGHGDIRLVLSEHSLYYWNAKAGTKGLWTRIAGGAGGSEGGVSTLDQLLDVVIENPQEGDVVAYDADAGMFINKPATGTDATKLPLTGGTLTGNLSMTTGTHITLPDEPVNPTDAVNKAWVEAAIAKAVAEALGISTIPTRTVRNDYLATAEDQVILVDARHNAVTITLPDTHTEGQTYELKDMFGVADITTIRIMTVDGDLIDTATLFTMTTKYQALTLRSDGTNWLII